MWFIVRTLLRDSLKYNIRTFTPLRTFYFTPGKFLIRFSVHRIYFYLFPDIYDKNMYLITFLQEILGLWNHVGKTSIT